MKVVLQRVNNASVTIDEKVHSSIDRGLLILLGIEHEDEKADVDWLVSKIVGLRIFNDAEGKMNLSNDELNGEYLVVSQFTLHASTKKEIVHLILKLPDQKLPYQCMNIL